MGAQVEISHGASAQQWLAVAGYCAPTRPKGVLRAGCPLSTPRRTGVWRLGTNRVPWSNSLFAMELGVARGRRRPASTAQNANRQVKDLRKGSRSEKKKGRRSYK